MGGSVSARYTLNGDSDEKWAALDWDEPNKDKYQYTGKIADLTSGTVIKYRLCTWPQNGDVRYLTKDETGTDFEITVNGDLEFILLGNFGASNQAYGVGTATEVTPAE